MAVLERAILNFETLLKAEFPVVIPVIEAEWNDGIKLGLPASYHWEEVPEKIGPTPAILIIPEGEDDPAQGDMLWDATLRVYVVITDKERRHLTKRILRYADALKRILRRPVNRTLYQYVVSTKVLAVRYGNTFMDRDNLFARDFNAEITLRLAK
jgi:hypothetical protein